jgi:nitrogen-specific signal transduction histidine kinase
MSDAAHAQAVIEAAPTLRPQARRISLLRLLLLSLALGIVLFFQARRPEPPTEVVRILHAGLVGVGLVTAVLAFAVDLARRRWQLALHLVFDLLWIGLLIYYTSGVSSPAVVLLFAVVLIGNLELPSVAPFAMPALASLVLAGNAVLYLAEWHPFPPEFIAVSHGVTESHRILGFLAIQIAALFLVDLLGQLLAARLIEQRLFTGELLDQLGEGVLAVDLQGNIAYANAEAMRLLGLGGVASGQPVARALAELPKVLELLMTGGPAAERSQGHRERELVLRATDLVGRSGKRIGRMLVVADETRLRILEANARRAEHLAQLGEMAAGIAHEVRNPLTSLRGCAQELADICQKLGQADAASLARIMIDESDRLARIVNDFLALSRLRSPERAATSVSDAFTELEALCRRRGDMPAGMHFEAVVEPGCPDAFADGDQLRQVLGNLVNNSIDAVIATPSPAVRARARAAPPDNPLGAVAVEVTVADNGCGIPAELHERVFAPFFSTKSRGTGLGLSLVSRIVREHEGAMKLESAPDKGTTVTIYLPAHSHTRAYARALGTPARGERTVSEALVARMPLDGRPGAKPS